MIWAILLLLGVPLWLCALGILALVFRSRALRNRPGNIPIRVLRTGRTRWTRAQGMWISNVFAWRGSPAAWSEDLQAVEGVSAGVPPTPTSARSCAVWMATPPWWSCPRRRARRSRWLRPPSTRQRCPARLRTLTIRTAPAWASRLPPPHPCGRSQMRHERDRPGVRHRGPGGGPCTTKTAREPCRWPVATGSPVPISCSFGARAHVRVSCLGSIGVRCCASQHFRRHPIP